MKIAVAQSRSVKGNVSANIEKHIQIIELAISENANAIFFPELSLTGYEPELAKELAINTEEIDFKIFEDLSNQNNITIGVGMPTKSDNGIKISMIIFQPNIPIKIYSKQLLHEDELPYFVCGEEQVVLTIENTKIALAICYESLQLSHSINACNLGAEIYLASVAKSQNGINKAVSHYPAISKKYSIPVLMANCVGYCDNFESAGQSAVWSDQGKLIHTLNEHDEGILLFNTETEDVFSFII